MRHNKIKLLLVLITLLLAGISPNLYPVAQAGIAKLSFLAGTFLIPSAAGIVLLIFITRALNHTSLSKQILFGLLAGLIATVGLEVIREIGFRTGAMPGDMPKLLGVLLLDRFAHGPNFWSNVAGWTYHFWNGAAFGIIFSLVFASAQRWVALMYGIIIGIVFMIGPATTTLGIGVFGLEFKDGYQFLTTVTLAHIVFGIVLGWSFDKLSKNEAFPNILGRLKNAMIGNKKDESVH
jgi:hypothetical protein